MDTEAEQIFSYWNGLHIYKFTENKIKFGFNPSELARVSKKIKFICVLNYTGRRWRPGRNTVPANWKQRIFDLFYERKSIGDDDILEVIERIYEIFLNWSSEHEDFRWNKIQVRFYHFLD